MTVMKRFLPGETDILVRGAGAQMRLTFAMPRAGHLLPLLLGLVAAALLIFVSRSPALVISFVVDSPVAAGFASVYYDDGGGYREQTSVRQDLRKGMQRYEFTIPAARIHSFRVDPANHDGATFVGEIEARSGGRVLRQFAPDALLAGGDVAGARVDAAAQGVRFTVKDGGSDPYFNVADSALDAGGGISRAAGVLVSVAFAMGALLAVLGLRREATAAFSPWPAVQLALAAGLVAAMAVLAPTDRSVSPDELGHLEAGRYYMDRWIPPAVGAPETLASYSGYGASYLGELDVVYFLAAKFAATLEFTGIGEVQRFRLFNVSLLALCILMALQGRLASLAVLPLLCTPQAWYVFAYFNADAFALVAALMLAAWVVSWFDRGTVHGHGVRRVDVRAALLIGALVALAFLSKRTFYPFLAFIAAYALWKCGFRNAVAYMLGFAALLLATLWHFGAPVSATVRGMVDPPGLRTVVGLLAAALAAAAIALMARQPAAARAIPRTLIVATVIAGALVGLRLLLEFAINGSPSEITQAVVALAEKMAKPEFRPSAMGTPAAYLGLALEARGVPLHELLIGKYLWIRGSALSLFGVYGYMTVFGPPWLYHAQHSLALALLALIALRCAWDGERRGVLLLGVGAMVLVVLVSMLHSWVRDLQAQGRYLFAILPVFGVLLAEAYRAELGAAPRGAARAAVGIVAALWLCGLVSFAFYGLPALARA
jgi:hypothetical protein